MRIGIRLILAICTALPVAAMASEAEPAPLPALSAVPIEQVEAGIAKIREFLYQSQHPGGHWEIDEEDNTHLGVQYGGTTALVTYALLASGESFQHPALEKAIEWLKKKKLRGTYAVALRAHVWSCLPDAYLPLLRQDARWLEDAAHPVTTGGLAFDYAPGLNGWSNSRTQYALLGLWEAEKRGIPVSGAIWQGIEKHLLASQEPDGGFLYNHTFLPEASAGMTAAGLTGLYVTREQIHLKDYYEHFATRKESRLEKSIREGLDYLQQHFQPHVDHGPRGDGFLAYYLYGIERVGLASGLRYFNGRDWFQEGAGLILERMEPDGGIPLSSDTGYLGKARDSAFCLLFLTRGRHPLLVQKMEQTGRRWNNRPDDAARLSRWISESMEKDLGWARLPDSAPAEAWGRAPLLYLASDEAPALSDQARIHLKHFLDQGSLLITTADGRSQAFTDGLEQLMRDLYPAYSYRPIAPDDRLLTHPWQVEGGKLQARSLHNGVRPLAIHFENDLSWLLHAGRHDNPESWSLLLNVLFHVTEGKAWLPPDPPAATESDPPPPVGFRLLRARHAGNWNSEPAAWPALAHAMKTRMSLDIAETPLADLRGAFTSDPLLISGTDRLDVNGAESAALKEFIDRGGTVLFENAGGMGRFTDAAFRLLQKLYPQGRLSKIPLDSPMIRGEESGGHRLDTAGYRTYAVLRTGAGNRLRLLEFRVDENPVRVFLSPDDLSQALTGRPCWGVYGYDSATAVKLVENLVRLAREPAVRP